VTNRFDSAIEKGCTNEPVNLGKPFFLFVGVASPRKNLERVIRAFARFKEDDRSGFRFVIAGDQWGQYSKRVLKPLVSKLTLQNWVEFHEYVSDANLVHLYSSGYCLVYPSLYEGFGYPILEAMHFGLPVITSNMSSCPEVGGDAAMYVNPLSEAEIAEAMRTITTNASLRRAFISLGKARCEFFSREKLASAYLRLLEGLSES